MSHKENQLLNLAAASTSRDWLVLSGVVLILGWLAITISTALQTKEYQGRAILKAPKEGNAEQLAISDTVLRDAALKAGLDQRWKLSLEEAAVRIRQNIEVSRENDSVYIDCYSPSRDIGPIVANRVAELVMNRSQPPCTIVSTATFQDHYARPNTAQSLRVAAILLRVGGGLLIVGAIVRLRKLIANRNPSEIQKRKEYIKELQDESPW